MSRNAVLPRPLIYLMAVAEHQSFTRASEALYISQPSLSQQIKQLEDSLNVKLLDRSGRQVLLTPAGEIYLQHATKALQELETAARAINDLFDLSRGSIRLAMTPITDYMTIPLLARFVDTYPGISVSTLEMPQHDMRDALIDNVVDMGIAFGSTLTSDQNPPTSHCHTLLVEKLNLVFSDDHPLASEHAPISKHALEQQHLILFNTDYALRNHIDQYCLEQGVFPKIHMEASSLSVIIEMTRHANLATILPESIAKQSGLRSAALLPELPHHNISMICSKDFGVSPACQAFKNLALDFYNEKSPTEEPHS